MQADQAERRAAPDRRRAAPMSAPMRNGSMKNVFLCLALAGLIVGCAKGPSDSEMKAALQKTADATMAGLIGTGAEAKQLGGLAKVEYLQVKSLGCKSDGDHSYRCDVQMEVKSMVGTQNNTESIRFIKTDSGWVPGR
jgi:hypothetical protein